MEAIERNGYQGSIIRDAIKRRHSNGVQLIILLIIGIILSNLKLMFWLGLFCHLIDIEAKVGLTLFLSFSLMK